MDKEWFCVETSGGTKLGDGDGVREFTNRESATMAARSLAPDSAEAVIVVKYTRKEIKTLKRRVTVDEADLPA